MPDNQQHKQKVVAVTGAATRIGAAIAKTLWAQQLRVIVLYNNSEQDALDLVRQLNEQRAESAYALHTDLTNCDYASVSQQLIDSCGQLDFIVNNASLYYKTPLEQLSSEQWYQMLDVHTTAPVMLAKHCQTELKQRSGAIVNILDTYQPGHRKDFVGYATAKAGLQALTAILAKEYAPNVRVNAVAPGLILSPSETDNPLETQVPMQRRGTADEVARAVAFLLLEATYSTGATLTVDGGRSLL